VVSRSCWLPARDRSGQQPKRPGKRGLDTNCIFDRNGHEWETPSLDPDGSVDLRVVTEYDSRGATRETIYEFDGKIASGEYPARRKSQDESEVGIEDFSFTTMTASDSRNAEYATLDS